MVAGLDGDTRPPSARSGSIGCWMRQKMNNLNTFLVGLKGGNKGREHVTAAEADRGTLGDYAGDVIPADGSRSLVASVGAPPLHLGPFQTQVGVILVPHNNNTNGKQFVLAIGPVSEKISILDWYDLNLNESPLVDSP